jgi:CRP/FNR family transcriptional regulator, nitrogen fixation regulation protein
MNSNRAGLRISEPGWTHERAASHRSTAQALESLAIVSQYHRDEEIYPQQASVKCWYRVISGAARRFVLRADGRRQTVDLLLPGDFYGFGLRGMHAFTAEAAAETVIARYPASRLETLAGSDSRIPRELSDIVLSAMSRLNSLLLILGRTTAQQKVGAFLLYMQERVGSGGAGRLVLPVSRYDIADYLALSVETVSRSLTALKERGAIALSGPREIGMIDPDVLTEEREAGEASPRPSVSPRPRPPIAEECNPSPLRTVPRSRLVEVRVPPFALGNVLGDMRRWLDHQRCDPSCFTCVREGSGAVVIRVEFPDQIEAKADAFEKQFAASSETALAGVKAAKLPIRSGDVARL